MSHYIWVASTPPGRGNVLVSKHLNDIYKAIWGTSWAGVIKHILIWPAWTMVINFGEENEKASIVHIDLSQGQAQKMINKKKHQRKWVTTATIGQERHGWRHGSPGEWRNPITWLQVQTQHCWEWEDAICCDRTELNSMAKPQYVEQNITSNFAMRFQQFLIGLHTRNWKPPVLKGRGTSDTRANLNRASW